MRGVYRFIAAVLLTLSAYAQGNLRDRDPDLEGSKLLAAELQQANLHYGRFYFISRLRLSDVGYQEQYYVPTGDNQGGVSISVEAPQRMYFVPHKKVIFSAEAVPGYSFFGSSFDGKNGQFNYRLRGDAHFLFNHLYLDVFTTTADEVRAQVSDVNSVATQRDQESGVHGEMKYSSRTSALFTLRYREVEYPRGRFQPDPINIPVNLLDRVERSGRVSLHHRTFPLTSLFVAAEAGNYGFRRATYKDSSRRYAGAGFVRNAGRTGARVEVGRTSLEFDDPAQLDFSGITGEVQLSRGNSRWNVVTGFERDLGFSIFLNNNYYVASLVRLNVERVANRRLTLRTGTSYERDDYDVPLNGVHRRDTITFTTVGFLYNLRRIRVGTDVGWYERETNFGDGDSGIRWLLHLSFTPTP